MQNLSLPPELFVIYEKIMAECDALSGVDAIIISPMSDRYGARTLCGYERMYKQAISNLHNLNKEQDKMAFQMNFSKEELTGAPPIPAGKYTLQLKGFKPKASALKPGETESGSVNLNPELVVVNHPDYDGRRVFWGMNSKAAFLWTDFVHACGLAMEVVQNEFAGTEKEQYTIPGVFEGSDDPTKKPEDWKYFGPLTNKTLDVEVAEIPAGPDKGGVYRQAKNDIRQFFCAVQNCTDKHSTNMIR